MSHKGPVKAEIMFKGGKVGKTNFGGLPAFEPHPVSEETGFDGLTLGQRDG